MNKNMHEIEEKMGDLMYAEGYKLEKVIGRDFVFSRLLPT